MVREVLTLNVGQCGIQLGQAIWEQYCAEHKIDKHGKKKEISDEDGSFHCFYEETDDKSYVPRNLMVDLEPQVIDDVQHSKYAAIYDNEFLLNGNEDAANLWPRGFYTVGADMIDSVDDKLRKLADSCDNLQGFLMNHSVGGGTGSGLGSLMLDRLAVDYRKKSTVGFEIYPSPIISTSVVAPYNALLSTHWLLDHTHVSMILDNEAIYGICQNNLDIKRPSYHNLNALISKITSSITTSLRFGGELNADLLAFQTNLVPFPRLHFMLTSMAPITTTKKFVTANNEVQSITNACFDANNFFTKIADFDAEEDKFMAISVDYRGNINASEANAAVQKLKSDRKVSFVEWTPTGFKIGVHEKAPPVVLEYDDIALSERSVVMIGNNTCISRVFSARISKKYDLLYSQRAFVHWYTRNGMEEGEFAEAREDIGFLEKDYLDVLSEQGTDDDYSEDDDDDEIGFAVGGAKDVNNFRECIQHNIVPSISAITYNGLLYQYYFDTKTRKNIQNKMEEKQDVENASKLFYPSYCYAKVKKLDFGLEEKHDAFEYFVSVGLNSNIKKSEFKRKHLNIIIVLDRSGSMWCKMPNEYGSSNKSRMEVANQASLALLKHLTPRDRFGFIAFDDKVEVIQKLQLVGDINMETVTKKILNIKAGGNNEFCDAYKKAVKFYDKLFKDNNYDVSSGEYDNRIMFITDAQIHIGCSDPNLLKYVKNDAEKRVKNRIYTTFIGIGLDFYSHLCEEIASCRGCNYYSVKTTDDFILKMDQEFEFMVTPLVFNVCLKLKCEGNVCEIEKVYRTKDKKAQQIMESGEVTKIGTLFPTLKSKKKGGTKGGIQLIKFKKNTKSLDDDNMNIELEVTYECRNGNKYKNCQLVVFNPPKLTLINDMIDIYDDDDLENDENENFYDNLGIRKGILLCKYVSLMKDWISEPNNAQYKKVLFPNFLKHFQKEMKYCNDKELQKEVEIMQKIIEEDIIDGN